MPHIYYYDLTAKKSSLLWYAPPTKKGVKATDQTTKITFKDATFFPEKSVKIEHFIKSNSNDGKGENVSVLMRKLCFNAPKAITFYNLVWSVLAIFTTSSEFPCGT